MPFSWRLMDASHTVLRESESFASRDEAEAWLGKTWRSLLDEGAEAVALEEDGNVVYEMGLRES